MRLSLLVIVAMGYCLLICEPAYTQDKETAIDKVLNFPSSFFTKVNQNTTKLEEQLTKQTSTYLQRLAKRNKILKYKLSKIDSAGVQQLFSIVTPKNSFV